MDRFAAREHNTKMAFFLCKKHGCDEKTAKRHMTMLVEEAWNPHPSPEFIEWWQTQREFREDNVGAIDARNCKVFVDAYKEAVEMGIARFPIDYPR